MKDVFKLQNPSYNLRSSSNQLKRENIITVYYGLQSVTYLDRKIWEVVPNYIKVGLSPSKKICVICLIESPLKMKPDKSNQTMKFDQLIEYNKINIFLQKLYGK